MKLKKLDKILARLIRSSFYALFFLVPLIMTPWNYELFEFNKMVTVYFFTIIIVAAWLMKMVLRRRIIFQRTFLDIPFLSFLVFQFFSFLFSIDRHTSLLGYYSRFNGGLISLLCYLLLYYALVSNLSGAANSHTSEVKSADTSEVFLGGALIALLSSATLVAIYGILQHFGIDKDVWVQDVQNRVFSTLGQPNWLAAYLVMIIPIAMGLLTSNFLANDTNKSRKRRNLKKIFALFAKNSRNSREARSFKSILSHYCPLGLVILFYTCLLFSKSRSGLLGFSVANFIFWLLTFFSLKHQKLPNSKAKISKQKRRSWGLFTKNFLIFNLSFLILSLIIGTPWSPKASDFIRRLTHAPQPTTRPITQDSKPTTLPGGTESGDIRKIVWQGAWSVFKSNPVLGTGPETFAYSYYWFRPVEHNLTSEWDFLYNKAHNEYLNLLACTGILGLGSYLFVVGVFVFWSLKQIPNFKFLISNQIPNPNSPMTKKLDQLEIRSIRNSLTIALFSGYFGLLVSNFFGFSVVATNLLFFLFPALAFVLVQKEKRSSVKFPPNILVSQHLSIFIIVLVTCYLLHLTVKYWLADYYYAQARSFNKAGQYSEAAQKFKTALQFNPWEPLIQIEAADNFSQLDQISKDEEEANDYQQKAKDLIKKAIEISPYNLNHLKIAARVYYRLSNLNEESLLEAFKILKTAAALAPTDAKIFYNLSLLYAQIGETNSAIETLQKTLRMKEDYHDAWYALSLFYEETEQKDKAIQALEEMLKRWPDSQTAQAKLEELKGE